MYISGLLLDTHFILGSVWNCIHLRSSGVDAVSGVSVRNRVHLWSSGVDAVSGVQIRNRVHLWSSGLDAMSIVPCLKPHTLVV